MPLVRIDIMEGRPPEKIRELHSGVAALVAEILDTPIERVRTYITQFPPEGWGIGGGPPDGSPADEGAARRGGAPPRARTGPGPGRRGWPGGPARTGEGGAPGRPRAGGPGLRGGARRA